MNFVLYRRMFKVTMCCLNKLRKYLILLLWHCNVFIFCHRYQFCMFYCCCHGLMCMWFILKLLTGTLKQMSEKYKINNDNSYWEQLNMLNVFNTVSYWFSSYRLIVLWFLFGRNRNQKQEEFKDKKKFIQVLKKLNSYRNWTEVYVSPFNVRN